MNEEQKKIFQQFKARVEKYNLDDATYLRFLQARKFKIKPAKKMIKNWIAWRKKMRLDECTIEDFQYFTNLNIYHYLCKDKWGRPVGIGFAKNLVLSKIKNNVDEYLRFFSKFLENMSLKGKGKCDTFSFIFDTGDVSWKNTDLSITKNQMLINLDYFPEKIYRLYIVNTGFFQRTIWTILTPILEQKTIDKFRLAGTDKTDIYRVLNQEIDHKYIPSIYGGDNYTVFY